MESVVNRFCFVFGLFLVWHFDRFSFYSVSPFYAMESVVNHFCLVFGLLLVRFWFVFVRFGP